MDQIIEVTGVRLHRPQELPLSERRPPRLHRWADGRRSRSRTPTPVPLRLGESFSA
jgi:hypothetical protein